MQKPFDSDFTVTLNKAKEGWLISSPTFYNVALALENATEQDVVLVLWSDVENELDLANFSEKIVDGTLGLTNEGV